MSERVCVVGLGEIGGGLLKQLHAKDVDVFGVDIDTDRCNWLNVRGYRTMPCMQPACDIYIICVYTTQQVIEAIRDIDTSARVCRRSLNNPLVIIESTIEPGTYEKLLSLGLDICLFPHRFNPNDPDHAYFNIDRVIGGTPQGIGRAIRFYEKFIPHKYLHIFPARVVELAKPLENAYRFMEIAFAEELALLCEQKNIDFYTLKEAVNTKWNIDIKDAREGVGGKCLPKDMEIVRRWFKKSEFFKLAVQADKEYKRRL